MSKTTDTLDWLRPFHDAAEGRTSDALDAALAEIEAAPECVRSYAMREGLRIAFHALRRAAGIRVNGDADTMPLWVATTEADGTLVHQMRSLVTVAEISVQLSRWGERRAQAGRELSWWTHQAELAKRAESAPTDTLLAVWDRLGVNYELFVAEAE